MTFLLFQNDQPFTHIFENVMATNDVIFVEVCSLSPDKGPCQASQSRYYFDTDDEVCRPFTYGGCIGNGNNFHTVEECQLWCLGSLSGIPVTIYLEFRLLKLQIIILSLFIIFKIISSALQECRYLAFLNKTNLKNRSFGQCTSKLYIMLF